MSTQPIYCGRRDPATSADAKAAQKRQAWRSDALYIAGAACVTIGVGFFNWKLSLIVAGTFCLLPPVLELASGFVKGLRVVARR